MCHNPAKLFRIKERGFVREGYFADIVLIDLNKRWKVDSLNILSKCGWSPFEGYEFKSSVENTFVSGNLLYQDGHIIEGNGQRLKFDH